MHIEMILVEGVPTPARPLAEGTDENWAYQLEDGRIVAMFHRDDLECWFGEGFMNVTDATFVFEDFDTFAADPRMDGFGDWLDECRTEWGGRGWGFIEGVPMHAVDIYEGLSEEEAAAERAQDLEVGRAALAEARENGVLATA